MTSLRMRDASAGAFAHLIADLDATDRSTALGTAYGQITYAMLCLREGRTERALEALQTGKEAINAACPHLTDFWLGRDHLPIGRAAVAEVER